MSYRKLLATLAAQDKVGTLRRSVATGWLQRAASASRYFSIIPQDTADCVTRGQRESALSGF